MCLVLSTKVESHDGFRGPLYLRARQPASQFSPLPVNIMPDRNTGVVMRDDAQIAILETFFLYIVCVKCHISQGLIPKVTNSDAE